MCVSREITLDEYVHRLPWIHRARKEYFELLGKPDPRKAWYWYLCDCGHQVLTEAIVEGVTPMYVPCKKLGGCERGQAASQFNVRRDQWPELEIAFEWFKPDEKVLATMSDEWRSHVEDGGLVLRKKGETEPLQ